MLNLPSLNRLLACICPLAFHSSVANSLFAIFHSACTYIPDSKPVGMMPTVSVAYAVFCDRKMNTTDVKPGRCNGARGSDEVPDRCAVPLRPHPSVAEPILPRRKLGEGAPLLKT